MLNFRFKNFFFTFLAVFCTFTPLLKSMDKPIINTPTAPSSSLSSESQNNQDLVNAFAQLRLQEKAQKLARLALQKNINSVDIAPAQKTDTETQLQTPAAWTFFSKGKKEDPAHADQSLTEKALIELINKENRHIRAALFEFNLYPIAYALCKAHARGVPVELIMNGSRGTKRSTAQLLVQRCGIPIRYYTPTSTETREGGGILHTKIFIFESNEGMSFLNDVTHHDNALHYCTPFFWTGSTNIAGNATEKNMETSSVLTDNRSLEEALERFQTIWQASEQQTKTDRKLGELELVEINTSDLKTNGVPSMNTLYLLQSLVQRPELGGTIHTQLTPTEILTYQEFVPENDPTVNTKQKMLPRGLTLPKPCFLCIGQDAKCYAYGTDNTWYNLHDDLVMPEEKIKLNGIGTPITVDREKWFFRTEMNRETLYYTLGNLQVENEQLAQRTFHGPFIKNSYGYFDYAPLSRLRKAETYTLADLQIAAKNPQLRTKSGQVAPLETSLAAITK
ncbi:hypothetical protein CVU75_00450 [Candidatus Dependentiae bacterium HGW-Dependentiae-1]|nr:MAG: hypothetical protein CVU75_00450 [Candidatus Dependentiae bacterium HGW-Dependentiae-1]